MTKELVTIEFRYYDAPTGEYDGGSRTKIITIGVYDTFEEAIVEGNKALEVFEGYFKLNTAWNKKRRFSKNGGCFGSADRLISPLAYLQCPFDFYAKITPLEYADVDQTITEVLEANKRNDEYKKSQQEDQ